MKTLTKKMGTILFLVLIILLPESDIYSDSSCSISSFTMTPSGTVPLGTHVFLEGHSNCGTVKFTVNGISKAEIGQGNQTETLKTEEFGTGTLEVCFLARGDGGWENANKSCKTLYVQGSQGAPEGSSTNGHCWVKSFTASPGKVQVGNTIKLAGYGQCDGNARASKFTIDGKSFNEKGSNTNDASWNTSGYSTGSHKVCFLITSGEWDDGSKSCTTVTLKSNSQEPNAPAQGDPADNRPTAIPSTSSSNGSSSSSTTSNNSCPNHYVSFNTGDYGKVTPGPPNNYRSCAGKSCKKLGEMPGGAEFKVLGGPTCADGYWWWKVSYAGNTGWTAEGNAKTAWLTKSINQNNNTENRPKDSAEDKDLVTFDFYYSPFKQFYTLTIDKQSCMVVNSAEFIATEMNRAYKWAKEMYQDYPYLVDDYDLFLYLKNEGEIDTFRVRTRTVILQKTGCLEPYFQLSDSATMDTSGLGNIMYGYFSIFIDDWAAHGIAHIIQLKEDHRLDFPDDGSQIDLGRSIAESGDYITADVIRSSIPTDFISSK